MVFVILLKIFANLEISTFIFFPCGKAFQTNSVNIHCPRKLRLVSLLCLIVLQASEIPFC